MEIDLPEVLERIIPLLRERSHFPDNWSLLCAYADCLTLPDLCTAIQTTITDPELRLQFRRRLVRRLEHLEEHPSEKDTDALVALVAATATSADNNKSLRTPLDALHSAVFKYLPSNTKQMLLKSWIARGTRAAAVRWLNATRDDPSLFDAGTALAYWQQTRDERAAKALAYQSTPEELANILPELIQTCDVGWIISKAFLRSASNDQTCWNLIRESHPATYLYLCAKTQRRISNDAAFELTCRCSGTNPEGGRGLAIWALGQMRMLSVLDRLIGVLKELQQRDMTELMSRERSNR